MGTTGRAERLIQASGCGPFQILLILLVYCGIKVPSTFSMMFMAFGVYNPGWRCLDDQNGTVHVNNTTLSSLGIGAYNETSRQLNVGINKGDNVTRDVHPRYTKGTCPDFEACSNVEFDPDVSTIVTEWGLICDKNWIASLIISIQMAGLVVGAPISGYVGDAIGRKKVLYSSIGIVGVLNIIAAFLDSWQAFAAVRFLFGIVLSCVLSQYCVLPSEFLNTKWRGRFLPLPTWAFAGIVMGLTAMLCKDWRKLHLIGAGYSFVFFLAGFWVPESLRWLEVKGKTKEFDRVAKKIISMNNVKLSYELANVDDNVFNKDGNYSSREVPTSSSDKRYTFLDLFRHGYRLPTMIFAALWFSCTIIYFAISFGIKAMSGDFFVNLIIYYAIEIPFCVFPVIGPNLLGRKKSSIVFMVISAVGLLTAAIFEIWTSGEMKHIGTLTMALLAKTFVDSAFYTLVVHTAEVYPTAVRSIANGFANFASKIGGILAPLLIPSDPDTVYISYIVMGILGAVCCFLLTLVPETKGKTLKETFEDDDGDGDDGDREVVA